ncbi:MAG: amidohydrolase family protein [Candidatus Marinimicrobia bacterium]|nr:amidohydrolase family protein [Candidatus Neomarinimicrobiota bacterium]
MKNKISFLNLFALVSFILLGCKLESNVASVSSEAAYSPAAQALIQRAFAPFKSDTLVDHHVHVLGMGNSGSGIEVHPNTQSFLYPNKFTRFNYFMDASGILNKNLADEEYLEYLFSQINAMPVPYQVLGLALDKLYSVTGEIDSDNFEIFVPNSYVFSLSEKHPDKMLAAISVHPYRKDAVAELEKWAAQGVQVVKWVPNAQGIDPASELCDSFYEAMHRLDMTLLTHAGTEQALDSQGRQHLGNPLLLRRALEAKVKVIIAHCAISGESEDIDDPGRPDVDNFELFMRLFDNPKYEGLLFADISGMTLLSQVGDPLKIMLARVDLHHRLLYGSDYPLPAVSVLNQNLLLSFLDYIDEESLSALKEIQSRNPLLYNFVLVRSLKHPENGAQFSEDLFRNRIP